MDADKTQTIERAVIPRKRSKVIKPTESQLLRNEAKRLLSAEDRDVEASAAELSEMFNDEILPPEDQNGTVEVISQQMLNVLADESCKRLKITYTQQLMRADMLTACQKLKPSGVIEFTVSSEQQQTDQRLLDVIREQLTAVEAERVLVQQQIAQNRQISESLWGVIKANRVEFKSLQASRDEIENGLKQKLITAKNQIRNSLWVIVKMNRTELTRLQNRSRDMKALSAQLSRLIRETEKGMENV